MGDVPVVWEWNVGPRVCVLLGLKNVEDSYELSRGVSRAKDFPTNACFHMDPEFKKDITLSDNLDNMDRLLVVSKRLKEFVERSNARQVEYLRVTIINHKNRVASDEYFIINPLSIVDCIDKKKSDLLWNAIDPLKIASCDRLVLNPRSFENEPALFRLKHLEHAVMVDRKLVDAITGEGFTGIRFTEIDSFER